MTEATNLIEQDTDIVRRALVDNQNNNAELDIRTAYIERDVPVIQRQRIPLYVNGQLKNAVQLAALGLSVREYTRLEIETAQYAAYYEANPTLAERVRQYQTILDAYSLEYNASSDAISAAIMSDENKTDAEKTTAAASLLALIHDIELNWNEVSGDGLTAWAALPKLIRFLPEVSAE